MKADAGKRRAGFLERGAATVANTREPAGRHAAERRRQLEARLAEIRRCLPAHSVKPELYRQIEELEEELERLAAEEGLGEK